MTGDWESRVDPVSEIDVWTLLGATLDPASGLADPMNLRDQLGAWGRYRDLRLLGCGGGGAVFEAFDPRLERFIALKFPWATHTSAERALAEARAQAKIDHPNVVKVFETGRVQGLPYIAMQLVEGPPLASLRGRLDTKGVIQLIAQAAEGLAAAHAQGLIHLDVKPANILVDGSQPDRLRALLSDFGLVSQFAISDDGARRGTPAFASPEQMGAVDAPTGPWSDIYGLGACLHFMVGGDLADAPPGGGWRPLPPPPASLAPDLAALIRLATMTDPHARVTSATEVAARLEGMIQPRSRWIQTIFSASLAVVLATAAIGYVAWKRAKRSILFEQQCTQTIRDLETRVRFARTSPQHNIRSELDAVRDELQAWESRLASTPAEGQGPTHAALGRGWLALGEPRRALDALRWAWTSGYRTPSCTSALGQAYAAVYLSDLDAYGPSTSPCFRTFKDQEFKTFGAPAMQLLRTTRLGPGESPAYIAALVLQCQDFGASHNVEALHLAREAQRESPWLYEANQLEGALLMGMVQDAQGAGDEGQVEELFRQARRAFEKARRIGRSDEKVLIASLAYYMERMNREMERRHLDSSTVQEAEALVADARAIAPGPDVDLAELALQSRIIEGLPADNHAEAQVRFIRSMALGRQLIKGGPQAIRARKCLADILLSKAKGALDAGQDPTPFLDEGETLQQGLVDSMAWTKADLMPFEQLRLVWDVLCGNDPLPRMLRAEPLGLEGLIDYKGDYGAPELLCRSWNLCARAALERGQAPGVALSKARGYAEEALRLCTDAPAPKFQLAQIRLQEAQAALLQERSLDLTEPISRLNELAHTGFRPTSVTTTLAKAHLLLASAQLCNGTIARENLRLARKALEHLQAPQMLDAGLVARLRMMEAAGAAQDGHDVVPLLEAAERTVRQRRAGYVQNAALDALGVRIAATLAWLDPRPQRLAKARKVVYATPNQGLADTTFGIRLLAQAGQGNPPERSRIIKALAVWIPTAN